MAERTAIDAAYRRGQILVDMLKNLRDQELAEPTRSRWVDLGIASPYETKEQSIVEIRVTFDELFGLIDHLMILDMASSFELASQNRIGTRIGEARSALQHGTVRRNLPAFARKLIRNKEDFGSLRAVEELVENHTDKSVIEAFKAVREARNNFAHGTNISSPPVVEPLRARDNLNEVLKLL